jgi:CheY-like chemotaxis protein
MRDLGSFSLSERDRVPVAPPEVLDLAIGLGASAPRHVKLIRRIEAAPMVLGNRWQLARVLAFALQHVADAVSPDDPEASIQLTVGVDPRGWAGFVIDGRGPRTEVAAVRAAAPQGTAVVREGSVAMAIAEHVIDEHGGAMRFRDGAGGREVEIDLPPVRRGVLADRRAPAPGATRGSVLVIDDEPMIGRVLEITLQAEHDVKAVTSAASALTLHEQGDAFDVILCDLQMPGMTGQELHEHLRHTRPDVASRMIFMSAGARTPEGAAFLETVADRRIDKPFRTDQLLPLVRERGRALRAGAD